MRSVKKRSAPTIFVDPAVFKSYDIRGTVPDQLNADVARLIGRGFAAEIEKQNIVVGRDMRTHSEELADALIEGLLESGCSVTDIGMVSTDALYFAVGHLGADGGVMVTASHNPPEYNGFKMCRENAEPLSGSDGLDRIQDSIELDDFLLERGRGSVEKKNILDVFVDHALTFVDVEKIKPFKVVIDAGNGMGGVVLPRVFDRIPATYVPLFFEPDGTFPNHLANPIDPNNLKALKKAVKSEKADFGVAFDGDADRMFLMDENGEQLGGDMAMLLVIKSMLKKNPGATILYNLICSNAVPELIEREGGNAIRTPVGHAIIKPMMKKENALFGGEHSGHFYFRDNWYADSGLIAMLIAMESLSEAEKPVSELIDELDPYFRSGETNVKVRNIPKTLDKIVAEYSSQRPDYTDGVTVNFDDWWFNARPSNTEPLLRLNVEAKTAELLEEKTATLLKVVKGRRKAAAKKK